MNKVRVIILLIFVSIQVSYAQQMPLYSLFALNEFIVNPAVASLGDSYTAKVNNRYQFVGIENAPVTSTLSLYGPSKKLPMGWGGIIFSDSQGALAKFGAYGSYAYKIPITEKFNLSLGLHIGVVQHTVDMTKIKFLDAEFNINESLYKSIKPDAAFGLMFEAENFFVGASLDQLFNNNVQVIDDTLYVKNKNINRLKNHYTLIAGYKHEFSENFSLEPTISFRKSGKTPFQLEGTVMFNFMKIATAGVSYRLNDAFVLLVGYNYRDRLQFAYAYDITYSSLRKGSGGAHEILISLNFNKVKSTQKDEK